MNYSAKRQEFFEPDKGRLYVLSGLFYFCFGGSFLGIAILAVTVQVHGTAGKVLSFVGAVAVGLSFGRRRLIVVLSAVTIAIIGVLVAELAIRGLGVLASVGVYGADKSRPGILLAETYLVLGALWLLLGIPHRAFRFHLDPDAKGDLQDVMTKVLATVAAIMNGVCIILFHYAGGPLTKINLSPLIVGDIFTVFLIVPIYSTVARACWRRGIIGLFSAKPLRERLWVAAQELSSEYQHYFYKKIREEYEGKARKPSNSQQVDVSDEHRTQRADRSEAPSDGHIEGTRDLPAIRNIVGQRTPVKGRNAGQRQRGRRSARNRRRGH